MPQPRGSVRPLLPRGVTVESSFRIGDKAVYPAHGVAEITGIETKEISGQKMTFYMLQIMETGMKLMVPTSKVATVGLRQVCDKAEVKEVYDILKSRDITVDGQTWNRRYREYMEKIKTGSVFEIAEVLRDLSLLKNGKDLSFGERKMLDHARSLLVRELAIAKKMNQEKVEKELEAIFSRAN
jgi:CarD family transcriptional regulator